MKLSNLFFVIFFIAQFFLISLDSAEAIPTFARKYQTACTTCHLAMPKRNPFGEAFRKNGYRIPGDDSSFIKEDPLKLGAPAWKTIFPNAIWPGSIPAAVPIAFYGHARVDWQEGGTNANMDAPHELELLLGGVWGENISFFGEWIVYEKGVVDEDRLGNLFVMFDDIFAEDVLNIKFGKFDVGAIGSFREDNRLTLAHFNTNNYSVDGKFSLGKVQPGVEMTGIFFNRLDYAAGLVNGNGSTSDNNNNKDVYYRVAYKLGGMPLTGPEANQQILDQKDVLKDDSIQIGQYGYFGRASYANAAGTNAWDSTFRRFGFDIRLPVSRFELGASYVIGKDNNVDNDGKKYDSKAYFAEGQAMIFPWMFLVIRYEGEDIKKDSVKVRSPKRIISNLTMLQMANLRWSLEHEYYPKDSDGSDRFRINFMFAF